MKDRIPTKPGRVLLTPEDGSTPFYATLTRADEPTQDGDLIGKNTLLKDRTAALYGLDGSAVPDDVLALLKTLVDNNATLANSKANIQTGSYVGTGTYGSSNPCSLTFGFPPKIVLVFRTSDKYQASKNDGYGRYTMTIFAFGGSKIKSSDSIYINYSISGNKLSWYSDSDSENQINYSNETYGYIGIG